MSATPQPTQPSGIELLSLVGVRAEDVSSLCLPSSLPGSNGKPPVGIHPATRKYSVGRKEADRHAKGPDELLTQICATAAAGDRTEVLALARQLAGRADAQIGDNEDLFPLPEVANKLDCGERTVWRLVASGELSEPVHVRGSAKWFRQDVREYLHRIRARRGK